MNGSLFLHYLENQPYQGNERWLTKCVPTEEMAPAFRLHLKGLNCQTHLFDRIDFHAFENTGQHVQVTSLPLKKILGIIKINSRFCLYYKTESFDF